MAESKTKRWPKKLLYGVVAFAALWVTIILVLIAAIYVTGTIDAAESADAIIVLGAGVTHDGRPGWALARRSVKAADLWHAGYAPVIICTGGQADNRPISEAEACRRVLNWRGVPDSAVVLEMNSRSTEENALNARRILADNNWHNALLVSDAYHILRAQHIFSSHGLDVMPSPVPISWMRDKAAYPSYVLREVVALHWQIFKDALNLPFTHVPAA